MVRVKRSTLKKKLIIHAKKQCRIRDNYTCQRCGKPLVGANAHGAHVIPVSRSLRLAYDLVNLICLCYRCHFYWWHSNPIEAGEWFKKVFPKRWKYLKRELRNIRPVTTQELVEQWEKIKCFSK